MRVPLLIAVALLLNGCGVPPAVSAASWVADGISLVASGKSITDHGISIVVQQDCAIFRVVRGNEICRPHEDTEVADAGEAEADGSSVPVAESASPATRGRFAVPGVVVLSESNPFMAAVDGPYDAGRLFAGVPGDDAVFQMSDDRDELRPAAFDSVAASTPAAAVFRASPAVLAANYYFVVGSFADRFMAERLARRLDEFPNRILPGIATNEIVHRVAVGPIPKLDADLTRMRLRAYGIGEPWVIEACGPYAPGSGCPDSASTGAVPVGPHG